MSEEKKSEVETVDKPEEFDKEGFDRIQRKAQEYEAKLRERLGKFNINEVLRQAKDLRSCLLRVSAKSAMCF